MTVALILGGAKCVFEDADRFFQIWHEADSPTLAVLAINDIGAVWRGPMHYWVSLHPDKLTKWMDDRAQNGLRGDYITVAHKNPTNGSGIKMSRILSDWGGSSGLLAVKAAKTIINAKKIVLAGVPMDDQSHFFDNKPWEHSNSHRFSWSKKFKELMDDTRSMSGWTREHLGEPKPDWLRY